MGASSRWDDWPAVVAPSPSRRWLLWPYEFEKANSWKTRNPDAPKPQHEIHSSPATATTSRRRATKHIPRVSSYTPASIDPEFLEIGLVQLSQLPTAKTPSVASFPRPVFLQQMVQKKEKKQGPKKGRTTQQGIPCCVILFPKLYPAAPDLYPD